LALVLKNIYPIIKVNIGTREFSIPANELSIFVCALANKKAGIRLPIIPTIIIGPIIGLLILGISLMVNGSSVIHAIIILNRAISWELKKTKDFFIRIKELPQIKARETRHK